MIQGNLFCQSAAGIFCMRFRIIYLKNGGLYPVFFYFLEKTEKNKIHSIIILAEDDSGRGDFIR